MYDIALLARFNNDFVLSRLEDLVGGGVSMVRQSIQSGGVSSLHKYKICAGSEQRICGDPSGSTAAKWALALIDH